MRSVTSSVLITFIVVHRRNRNHKIWSIMTYELWDYSIYLHSKFCMILFKPFNNNFLTQMEYLLNVWARPLIL